MDITNDKGPRRSAGPDARQIMINDCISLIRKAERPGHTVDEFVRARRLAFETLIPQVQLVALHSVERTIKTQAWLNLNLEGSVIKLAMGRMESDSASADPILTAQNDEIRKLAADALRLHDYAANAGAMITDEERSRIREKALKHHQHDQHAEAETASKAAKVATARSAVEAAQPIAIEVPLTLIAGSIPLPSGIAIRT